MNYKTIMKIKILFFLLSLTLIFLNCRGDKLNKNNFLIVTITEEDLKNENIPLNKETRYNIRKLHSDFLKQFKNKVKFIILDYWYPDEGIKSIDDELIKEMESTKNFTIGCGGIYNGYYEITLDKFLNAVNEAGSYFFNFDKEGYLFYNNIFNFSDYDSNLKNKNFRHVSAVVLDFLKIPFRKDKAFYMESKDIVKIEKISYSKLKNNNKNANDKILILVSLIKFEGGNLDVHHIPKYGEIIGSELLVNFILNCQE